MIQNMYLKYDKGLFIKSYKGRREIAEETTNQNSES